MPSVLDLSIVPGAVAPRYSIGRTTQLTLLRVVITEEGTENHLPVVDLVLQDAAGHEYFTMVTGRIMNAIAAAVRGVNLRVHGVEEP